MVEREAWRTRAGFILVAVGSADVSRVEKVRDPDSAGDASDLSGS